MPIVLTAKQQEKIEEFFAELFAKTCAKGEVCIAMKTYSPCKEHGYGKKSRCPWRGEKRCGDIAPRDWLLWARLPKVDDEDEICKEKDAMHVFAKLLYSACANPWGLNCPIQKWEYDEDRGLCDAVHTLGIRCRDMTDEEWIRYAKIKIMEDY